MSPMPDWHFHFAQTFPLHRRGYRTGAFHWFKADPRPGVELDLRQVSVPHPDEPNRVWRDWQQLEHAFGITEEQQAARKANPSGFRFYICPTNRWDTRGSQLPSIPHLGERDDATEVWSRDELAHFLHDEAERWLREREMFTPRLGPGTQTRPKYYCYSKKEAEMFEMMEKLPCTAIGMWLFPAEAFRQDVSPQLPFPCFNVAAFRPGLFLFQV